ncbi:MAG: ice-binding family protein [bacterium]|nr:ice-binding family protein [bacterium]
MKNNILFLCVLSLLISEKGNAQVGIGTVTPEVSSALDIHSTDKGFLLPRLTTIQRDAISSPATGLLIYNTTTSIFNFYNLGWKDFITGLVLPINGGTGIANSNESTLALPGEFATTITTTGVTNVTLPTAGTVYGTQTGSITSAQSQNSLIDETGTKSVVFSDSPTFTGISLAPTAAVGTNTTQLATTAFVLANSDNFNSVTATEDIVTNSNTDVLIPGLSLTPVTGTYLVMFNSQYNITSSYSSRAVNTDQGRLDLKAAYDQLNGVSVTNVHAPALGSGEILTAGVYSIGAAGSIAGVLTLDAQGNPNAVFVFKIGGAFTTGAGTVVALTNGALACNVFWIVEGAASMAASTTMKGTVIANNGAVFMGANGTLEGRLFSTTGAISFGPGTAYMPLNCSYLDLGTLSTFVIFTSNGAISNTGNSYFTGDIGTNLGDISGFEYSSVNGSIIKPGTTTVVATSKALATFSIYQNGVLVPNSSRTCASNLNTGSISLQAIATVSSGQNIDIRWKIDSDAIILKNRILTIMSVR